MAPVVRVAAPPGPFLRLQALDDAIAYRQARAAAPCPDCGRESGRPRCDDHACDLDLIAAYHAAAQAECRAAAAPRSRRAGG